MEIKNVFPKILIASLILLIASTASAELFTVNEPDGTNDTTSSYFTVQWTGGGQPVSGVTVSCYADRTNSGYDKTYTAFEGVSFTNNDDNSRQIKVNSWEGRQASATYYIWCQNDSNHDMNDYSGGTLTVARFAGEDIGSLGIDFAAYVTKGIAENAYVLGAILVIIVVVILLFDMLTGVFGIIARFRAALSR